MEINILDWKTKKCHRPNSSDTWISWFLLDWLQRNYKPYTIYSVTRHTVCVFSTKGSSRLLVHLFSLCICWLFWSIHYLIYEIVVISALCYLPGPSLVHQTDVISVIQTKETTLGTVYLIPSVSYRHLW